MKKLLSIALLCSGALCAAETAKVSPELANDLFDYKSRKMALASEYFKAMAELADDDDLQEDLEEISGEFDELTEQFGELEVPEDGIMISLQNKEKWDAIKKEGQALKERKEKEIEQSQADTSQESEMDVVLVEETE